MNRVLAFLAIFLVAGIDVSATVIHVPSEYTTIQAAINASLDGDTVLVSPGTYVENLSCYSPIALISEDGPEFTIIQSDGSNSPVIGIYGGGADARLCGFTIRAGNFSGAGGGITVSGGTISIHDNIIGPNSSLSGGALAIINGNHVRIYDNEISGNSCSAMGGAIYCSGGSNNEICDNVIENNSAGVSGGGIFIEYGSGNIIHHNLIVYNSAGVRGGGVLFKDSGQLNNNTIAFNTSVTSTGGGIAFEEGSGLAKNNIICNNTGYGICCYGVNPLLTYNDVWGNAQGEYQGVNPGVGSIVQDPQFIGGLPFNFHLGISSPCINAGDPESPLDPDSTRADMGAFYTPSTYEIGCIRGTVIDTSGLAVAEASVSLVQFPIAVTTDTLGMFLICGIPSNQNLDLVISSTAFRETTLTNIFVPTNDTLVLLVVLQPLPPGGIIRVPLDFSTIQGAINASHGGDTVLVSDGEYAENINFLGKAIAVVSQNGPDSCLIRGASSGEPVVSIISGEGRNAMLAGFTIQGDSSENGIQISGSAPTIYGNIIRGHERGIFMETSHPLVRKNEIFGCECQSGGHGGGAIRMIGCGGVSIDSNVIHDNYGAIGGAMHFRNSSGIRFERNLVYQNRALNDAAMGIDACSNVDIINNTFAQNTTPPSAYGSITIWYVTGVNFVNNIVAFTTEWGVYNNGSSGVYFAYNDVVSNANGDLFAISEGPGCISQDPLFVDTTFNDYRLSWFSPCLNTGDPSNPLDPDGSPADMGALAGGFAGAYGFIAGGVSDTSGAFVPDARIGIMGTPVSCSSDLSGLFILGPLPSGRSYDLLVTHENYYDTTLAGVAVEFGETTFVSISLRLAPPRGAVEGVVTDSLMHPISGVSVSIASAGISDVTGVDGTFFLGHLRPQAYDILFSRPLFRDTTVLDFQIVSGDTAVLNISMKSETNGYFLFFGNLDGSPIPALVGDLLELPVWGSTEQGNFEDSVTFMHIPLAANTSIIQNTLEGTFPDTLVGRWDESEFLPQNPNYPSPGWINRSMLGFAFLSYPYDSHNFFWTNGGIAPICNFRMIISPDTSLIGDTLSPFIEGSHPANGGLIWGMQDGITSAVPTAFYPQIYFVGPDDVGYISGNVLDNQSIPVEGVTVAAVGTQWIYVTNSYGYYLINWLLPGSYDLWFFKEGVVDTVVMGIEVVASETAHYNLVVGGGPSGCTYVPGDINGNGVANGIDVGYGVSFFKGGPLPPVDCGGPAGPCPQPVPFYAAGDVNGSCVFNGLDITYYVRILRGLEELHYCPDCLPASMIAPPTPEIEPKAMPVLEGKAKIITGE